MRAEGICQEENANLSVIVQAWHLGASSHSSSQLEPGTFQPPPAASSQAGTQKEHPGWINLILGVLLYPHSRRRCQQRLTDDVGTYSFSKSLTWIRSGKSSLRPPAPPASVTRQEGGRIRSRRLYRLQGQGSLLPEILGALLIMLRQQGFDL